MNGFEPILAICDREMNYACHLMEYLREHTGVQCEIRVYSGEDKLFEHAVPEKTALLVIAESVFSNRVLTKGFQSVLILNESERYLSEDIPNISKYQSVQTIAEVINNMIMGREDIITPAIRHGRPLKILGLYTPVSRCLQTTAAFSLGEILARTARVLYLNFEAFSGLRSLCGWDSSNVGNIMDILYYSDCARDKFSAQLSANVRNINGMDCVLPAGFFMEIREVRLSQWLDLFEMISKVTEYEFLILDLTEQADGLLDILRHCSRVYMFERDDDISEAKISAYEEMLKTLHYEDVFMKTVRCRLPVFKELPARLSNMDRGEIAEFVRELLKEEGYERL